MYPGSSYINHSCYPNAVGIADGRTLVFEALRAIAAGDEILQCYTSLPAHDEGSPLLADWGFACDCPRCSKTLPSEVFAAFDAEFRCGGCHCVTTSCLRQATADAGGVCQCNPHSRRARPR